MRHLNDNQVIYGEGFPEPPFEFPFIVQANMMGGHTITIEMDSVHIIDPGEHNARAATAGWVRGPYQAPVQTEDSTYILSNALWFLVIPCSEPPGDPDN